MAPRLHELHADMRVSREIRNPPLPYGFQSDDEYIWYTHYFRAWKIIVERLLDNIWSQLACLPFFLTKLGAYPS